MSVFFYFLWCRCFIPFDVGILLLVVFVGCELSFQSSSIYNGYLRITFNSICIGEEVLMWIEMIFEHLYIERERVMDKLISE